MNTFDIIREKINSFSTRSAWDRGVNEYALELVDNLEQAAIDGYFSEDGLSSKAAVSQTLLNGADSWSEYSWGGSALIYNCDIAERLCCPTEMKKTRGGERRPNRAEEWLDVQARALSQAAYRVKRAALMVAAEKNR